MILVKPQRTCLSTSVEKVPGRVLMARPVWGSSSMGRAPALQAGGRGIVALLLHQRYGVGNPTRIYKSTNRQQLDEVLSFGIPLSLHSWKNRLSLSEGLGCGHHSKCGSKAHFFHTIGP